LPQYMRNVLQLNRGKLHPLDSLPVFSEIGFFSGIPATDWSWSVLISDVDLDTDQDLLVTNGFPRDVTDLDFMDYSSSVSSYSTPEHLLSKIPSVLISNYGFENDGNTIPQFENATDRWGLNKPSFSSGAATVDLDNDGDLDYVVNCINDSVLVYQNNIRSLKNQNKHFLQVNLLGEKNNLKALGAQVTISIGDKKMKKYQSPYRGYLSTLSTTLSFGLDTFQFADVEVVWPGGKQTFLKNVMADQLVVIDIKDASSSASTKITSKPNLLKEVAIERGLNFTFSEDIFVDFDYQRLLPRQLSQFGPVLAVGDANSDGLDDLLIGGPLRKPDLLWLQEPDGSFERNDTFITTDSIGETTSALFFDADNDGDDDLYIAHGSVEQAPGSEGYSDSFYRNVDGNLMLENSAIPISTEATSCVRAGDFDNDGDLDLFVGARVVAAQFPRPAKSKVFENINGNFILSQKWKINALGMVTDAVIIDIDNDGWEDLFIAEDWGKLRYFKAGKTGFSESEITALNEKTGCWNSILIFDGDNDGDLDIVAGNLGRNNNYHRDGKDFARIYAGDFDSNGTLDAIPATRFENHLGETQLYPLFQRQENQAQVIKIKDTYPFHKDFARANAESLIKTLGGNDSLTVEVNYLASIYLEQTPNGDFKLHELPREAQLAPICGLQAEDLNGDGLPEILIAGNDYGAEVRAGQMDAMHGLVLKMDSQATWNAIPYEDAGLSIPKDGTGMVQLLTADGMMLYIVGQNNGPLLAFAMSESDKTVYKKTSQRTTQTSGQAIPFGMGNASSSGRYLKIK